MTKAEILTLVTEGAKLDAKLKELKPDIDRLEEIKKLLRGEADGVDQTWKDEKGNLCTVKHTKDGVARTVPEGFLAKVKELAGRKLYEIFNLAPVKDFELNALRSIGKDDATKLVKLLTVPGQARVAFVS